MENLWAYTDGIIKDANTEIQMTTEPENISTKTLSGKMGHGDVTTSKDC